MKDDNSVEKFLQLMEQHWRWVDTEKHAPLASPFVQDILDAAEDAFRLIDGYRYKKGVTPCFRIIGIASDMCLRKEGHFEHDPECSDIGGFETEPELCDDWAVEKIPTETEGA